MEGSKRGQAVVYGEGGDFHVEVLYQVGCRKMQWWLERDGSKQEA